MDGSALTRAGAIALTTLLLGGCGGDDKPDDRSPDRDSTRRAGGLPRPLYPNCGTDQLTKPRTREITSSETRGRAWSIEYSGRTQRPGAIKTLLLVELSPAATLPRNKPRTKQITINGHQVTTQSRRTPNPLITAQWKTPRATYTMIIAGTNNTNHLHRIVGCLP